jgi:hypothetical protein
VGNELMQRGYMKAVSALHVDTAEAAYLYFMTYISHDAWHMFVSALNCKAPKIIKFSASRIVPIIKTLKTRISTAGFWQTMGQVELLNVSNTMAENGQAVGATSMLPSMMLTTTLSWMPMPLSMLMMARTHLLQVRNGLSRTNV